MALTPPSLPTFPRPRDAVPALLAALAFGVSTPLTKVLFTGLPWLFVGGWLYLTSGIGLALWIALRRGLRRGGAAAHAPRGRLGGRDVPWLAAGIAIGGVAAPYAYVRGVAAAPAQVSSLLLNLEVVFAAAVAVLAFRERLAPGRWVGVALVVGGGVLCGLAPSDGGGDRPWEGSLWLPLACLGWAVDSNLMRKLVGRDPVHLAAWKGLVGGAASLGLAVALGSWPAHVAPSTLALGAGVGVVAYGVSLVLYLESLVRLETSRTAALFGTAPFLGVLASWALLGERPTVPMALAGLLMALGVALLTRSPRRAGGVPAGPSDPAGAA